MLDKEKFKAQIELVLQGVDPALNTPNAVQLLLGTAAVGSSFGKYNRQMSGPALGVFQMEPDTFDWLISVYDDAYYEIKDRKAEEMVDDIEFAILMCRLRFQRRKRPLPVVDDIEGQARYWKRFYNTVLGAGTVEKYLKAYEVHVA